MLTHQKALQVKSGIMFGNLKNPYMGENSARTKNKTFHTFLIAQNFELSPVDPCMFVQDVNNQISIIFLWVDDILLVLKNRSRLNEN